MRQGWEWGIDDGREINLRNGNTPVLETRVVMRMSLFSLSLSTIASLLRLK